MVEETGLEREAVRPWLWMEDGVLGTVSGVEVSSGDWPCRSSEREGRVKKEVVLGEGAVTSGEGVTEEKEERDGEESESSWSWDRGSEGAAVQEDGDEGESLLADSL